MRVLEFTIWIFFYYNLMFTCIFFTLWANELLYDWPFNVGFNISTDIDALDDHTKSDPSADNLISLT